MNLKKLGAAMLASLALTAVFASVSQAGVWEVESTKFTNGQKEALNVAQIGTATFTSTVLGSPLKLTGTGVEDVGGELTQSGAVAGATGKLKFTGVTVDEPEGCKTSGSIETTALTAVAQMGNTEATAGSVYVKFTPTTGENFATIKLTECAAAGSYLVKGNVYAKAENTTGVLGLTQRIDSSAAINASQGGALTVGKEPAVLDGAINVTLSGEKGAGKQWRLTEN